MDEAAFLNKIQSEPKDDLARQIYADWLEERGDEASAKADYLRLGCVDIQLPDSDSQKEVYLPVGAQDDVPGASPGHRVRALPRPPSHREIGKLLFSDSLTVELAATEATKGWRKKRRKRLQELANCREALNGLVTTPRAFDFVCQRRWGDLQPTDNSAVRHCDSCSQNVYYCDTITTAREHAEKGQCVAVDCGVIRRRHDLHPVLMVLGRPSPEMMRMEEELMKPDPVSAKRENRKREKLQAE